MVLCTSIPCSVLTKQNGLRCRVIQIPMSHLQKNGKSTSTEDRFFVVGLLSTQDTTNIKSADIHPPYSPDLAPCDFYLFPKLKLKLKGHHFGTIEHIQKVVTDELNTLTENDSRYCYDQWKKRWNHCVTSQGSYFEGDHL